jgi:hypothetical protein
MARSPGGVGTAEQLLGTALPAGAVAKGAALIGDAAGAVPYLGRIAASPFSQATATGTTVGGVNAAGTGQDPVTGAVLGAGAGAAGSGRRGTCTGCNALRNGRAVNTRP